jgi:hypothetical protein
MRDMRRLALRVSLLASLAGCATARGSAGTDAEVALRRGSAWATYSLKPPEITGPSASLRIEDGRLRGLLASRAVDIKIQPDGASGFGPGGPVNVTIEREPDGTRVEGLWNGAPVNFVFSPAEVKGSVVVWQGRLGVQQASCAYDLRRIEPNGAVTGSSTCAGMPQETRLEVHAGTAKVLTPSELTVFLLAALSSPPLSPNERRL